MPSTLQRSGLRFEIAPPRAAHPNRTDIACFVGNVARRAAGGAVAGAISAMPALLAAWLSGLGITRLGGQSVSALGVDLASPAAWRAGLSAQAAAGEQAALNDALDGANPAALAELIAACRRLSPIDAGLLDNLAARGWAPQRLLGPDLLAGWLRTQLLLNVPIAVDSFDAFDRLFAWQNAPVLTTPIAADDPTTTTPLGADDPTIAAPLGADDPTIAAPLGAAVRAFFGEGGRRCWIVRSGDPAPLFAAAAVRAEACRGQIAAAAPRLDAAAWQGLEHVYGLPEVSFACLPDLISACAADLPAEVMPVEQLGAAEAFHDCVIDHTASASADGRRVPAPRLDARGLAAWRALVDRALGLLANGGRAFHRRDVQLLASLPLGAEASLANSFESDRLQLAWPWQRSTDSADCAGGIEAPEGTLAGVLARSALQRGAFRSIAGSQLARFIGTQPVFDASTPAERLCLIGPSPRGPVVHTDVTTAADLAMRQGAVRRLLNVVMQAARVAGDEFAFEPNGPALWQRLRERLGDLGRVLLAAGALSTDGVPFTVRCGRDTMTQADLDAGRLIAEIALLAAQPIQRIVVVLALRDAPAMAAPTERLAA